MADANALASWASNQGVLIAEGSRIDDHLLGLSASILLYGGRTNRLPVAVRQEGCVSYEELASWEDAPNEVAILAIPGINVGVVLHRHIIEVDLSSRLEWLESSQSTLDVITKAMAQAWGCIPVDVSFEEASGYEIGVDGYGGAVRSLVAVIVLRKPVAAKGRNID